MSSRISVVVVAYASIVSERSKGMEVEVRSSLARSSKLWILEKGRSMSIILMADCSRFEPDIESTHKTSTGLQNTSKGLC